MAYATGSAANLNALLDAIRSFALSQGWTIGRWTSASNLLFMSKGQCFVTMEGASVTYTTFPGGVSTNYNDTVLRMALGTSLNNSLTTYHSHPGSVVTSATDADRVQVNDLAGPFTAYYLFSGDEVAGDPAYIHVVVRTAANRWQHFSFGNIDRRGLAHSGAAYLAGQNRVFYRSSSAALNNVGQTFNHPPSHGYPFAGNIGTQPSGQSSCSIMLNVPDALPVAWAAPTIMPNNVYPCAAQNILLFERASDYGSDTAGSPNLQSNVVTSPTLAHSGVLPLWPAPCIVASNSNLCYIGDYPHVRLCNIEGIAAAQEISFGTEVWTLFPSLSQQPWGNDRTGSFDGPSTGQYGLAYRKIV